MHASCMATSEGPWASFQHQWLGIPTRALWSQPIETSLFLIVCTCTLVTLWAADETSKQTPARGSSENLTSESWAPGKGKKDVRLNPTSIQHKPPNFNLVADVSHRHLREPGFFPLLTPAIVTCYGPSQQFSRLISSNFLS
jgi:hypothetical protein